MPKLGAYFSLKGAVASVAFIWFGLLKDPISEGAAMIAAPVAVAFFIKFLLELSIP